MGVVACSDCGSISSVQVSFELLPPGEIFYIYVYLRHSLRQLDDDCHNVHIGIAFFFISDCK